MNNQASLSEQSSNASTPQELAPGLLRYWLYDGQSRLAYPVMQRFCCNHHPLLHASQKIRRDRHSAFLRRRGRLGLAKIKNGTTEQQLISCCQHPPCI